MRRAFNGAAPTFASSRTMTTIATTTPAPDAQLGATALHSVLVVDADPALRGLLDEWMGECGCALTYASPGDDAPPGRRYALVVADVPFPRQGGLERLRRLGQAHPGTPILALSPTFFGSVCCAGDVARSLGVARVLAKPVSRAALIAAARQLLPA
jgi:CheY-like chemotaxis protein